MFLTIERQLHTAPIIPSFKQSMTAQQKHSVKKENLRSNTTPKYRQHYKPNPNFLSATLLKLLVYILIFESLIFFSSKRGKGPKNIILKYSDI